VSEQNRKNKSLSKTIYFVHCSPSKLLAFSDAGFIGRLARHLCQHQELGANIDAAMNRAGPSSALVTTVCRSSREAAPRNHQTGLQSMREKLI